MSNYYTVINNRYQQLTASTITGAMRQATMMGGTAVYEFRPTDRIDRYSGEDVLAVVYIAAKHGKKWCRYNEFVEFIPASWPEEWQ